MKSLIDPSAYDAPIRVLALSIVVYVAVLLVVMVLAGVVP